MYKERDTDKVSISKLKQCELLALWLEWRNRLDDDVNIPIPEGCSDNIDHCNPLVDDHGDEIMIVNQRVAVININVTTTLWYRNIDIIIKSIPPLQPDYEQLTSFQFQY